MIMKLSDCTKEGQIFLFGSDLVGLQYILRMIWNGNELPEIRAVKKDENFDDAVQDVLHQMYADAKNGVRKTEYELKELQTFLIEIDITKDNIRQVGEYEFDIQGVETKSCK